mmetsp:Transcript_34365/g.91026  ORF Transcript_34365/g.91026 Transcript_34365/m.91026 type:complete len:220 (+) Transcript_34365:238-897(+)
MTTFWLHCGERCRSHILHRALILSLPTPPHLPALGLDALLPRGGAQDLHLHLVTDFVDLGVNGEDHGPKHAVSGEPEVQEVDKEHDFDDAADPGLDVAVVRHLDLLVDPIECIEDSVSTERDNVQACSPVTAAALAVAEDVLRHHSEALHELGERPQHLQHGVLVCEEDRGGRAGQNDHRQVARVVPAFIRGVQLIEEEEHEDRGGYVRQLEEHEICRL